LLTAYTSGSDYRERYGHLWDGRSVVPIFAAGDEPVLATARRFGQGYFGYNYSTNAALNFVPEVGDQGANSFSPPCFAPATPSVDTVTPFLPLFGNAAPRLNSANRGLNITTSDIYNLLNVALFKHNVRGARSLFRNLFTYDEWVVFNYIYATFGYYVAGPGTNSTIPRGSVLANATLSLLENGPIHHRNGTYFLGLRMPDKPLPIDYVDFGNRFALGQLTPQDSHIAFARLNCER
ncbi:histidine phosphatase superfamily, partial [Lipomyces starkeyi]